MLKVMKLRYCCNLTTTPDFSEITNLEVLDLEGCVNMVTVHPSIGMLKRLVVLNMRDCRRARSFPSKVEMDSLQVLNLSGCLNVNQQPEAFWSRWWTSIPSFIWNQQHPQTSVSLAGLHMLVDVDLSYCNLVQVPESIGGLSCLKELILEGNKLLDVPNSIGGLSCLKRLYLSGNNLLEVPESIGGLSCLRDLDLEGNNFTSLPRSLSQLSSLNWLNVNGCKKLEVLPELPHSLTFIQASDCTSLREVSGSSKDPSRYRGNNFENCPNLFKNVTVDREGSISKTECLDSSITSQGFIHQLSAIIGYFGFPTNRCEFFLQDTGFYSLNIVYPGNSIREWFTNRSTENHVKVELPSDWCFNKLRGFGTCVVFKRKKPGWRCNDFSVNNFDGASLSRVVYFPKLNKDESCMTWLHFTRDIKKWKVAKNFVTLFFQKNNDVVEVMECGVRLICDGDLQQQDFTNLSMFQDLPALLQHGGAISYSSGHFGERGSSYWSW
ncbi:Leucine-rich repeat-containing protein [Artemisia annua]|uniref:Leucine-rich repeat-containing protein n=1 Tax=Artemisia annua TaxID=35608 RepID=A0A2U1N264_ARTAN|nr:Leucine-rich repeat-containing protein [Artemisia annua]